MDDLYLKKAIVRCSSILYTCYGFLGYIYPRFQVLKMETVNYWIMVPFIILFSLTAIPIGYIWIEHFYWKLHCCSSKQEAAKLEGTDEENQFQSQVELIQNESHEAKTAIPY